MGLAGSRVEACLVGSNNVVDTQLLAATYVAERRHVRAAGTIPGHQVFEHFGHVGGRAAGVIKATERLEELGAILVLETVRAYDATDALQVLAFDRLERFTGSAAEQSHAAAAIVLDATNHAAPAVQQLARGGGQPVDTNMFTGDAFRKLSSNAKTRSTVAASRDASSTVADNAMMPSMASRASAG